MKLLKLYSNNPNFRTIIFRLGINLVLGLKHSVKSTDTYNGIGKSSSLQLIHLMLGGKLDPKKHTSDKTLLIFLSSYGEFFLDFEVGTSLYTIRVNFNDGVYYLNNEKVGKNKTLANKLSSTVFNLSNKQTTFKQLFNCFARRYMVGRDYYSDALHQQGRPVEDFHQRIVNLVLLGVDTSLPHKFKSIRDELEKIEHARNALKKHNLSKNESKLRDLEDQREKLLFDKENFVIAQNYNELQIKANDLTEKMNQLRNRIFSNDRNIRSKKNTLETNKDVQSVDISMVESIFNEANFHFPDLVQKQLKQAEDFHLSMHRSRKERLARQLSDLEEENKVLNSELLLLQNPRDAILKDLNAKGALEEFNALVECIRRSEAEISDLSSYQKAIDDLGKMKAKLDADKARVKLEAVEYIQSQDKEMKIEKKFRALVRRFYTDHGGALCIKANDGDAKYLFDIDLYIQKDGSQGVNEVKIFCYDMLLFQLNHNLLGFMAHDSALFNGVDYRQVRMMFKIILEMCGTHNLQYFVNINEDIYKQLLITDADDALTSEEKEAINSGIRLRLLDDSPKSTLFGTLFG